MMGFWSKLLGGSQTPPEAARNLRRNERCWCGSGKKYKQCHFEADRAHFTRQTAAACQGPT